MASSMESQTEGSGSHSSLVQSEAFLAGAKVDKAQEQFQNVHETIGMGFLEEPGGIGVVRVQK